VAPTDRAPLLKLIATGAFAFALVPVALARIKPGVGLFLVFLVALATIYAWFDAQADFAAIGATQADQTAIVQAMRALELAAALTAVLIGTITGALISLYSYEPK
jgi:hypothetical protein